MSIKYDAVDATQRLELGAYVPFFITAIANRWTSTSSRTYLRRFGIGIVEWRILASLASKGTASSLDVVNLVGMDPASVSKAIRTLEGRGMVVPVRGTFAGRTKPYEMTAQGQTLFKSLRELALERERILLAPLDATEREQLLGLLRKLHADLGNVANLV